jgi:hypothetical protein
MDVLTRVCDDGGRLLGAAHALLEGDARFITAVVLRFESLTAVFRAVPEDDTLAAGVGAITPDEGEVLVDVSRDAPWAECVGRGLSWAWHLTNQQGYTDGARFEFNPPDAPAVVEVVVLASAIRLFVSREVG